jgi:hypothetical protein
MPLPKKICGGRLLKNNGAIGLMEKIFALRQAKVITVIIIKQFI